MQGGSQYHCGGVKCHSGWWCVKDVNSIVRFEFEFECIKFLSFAATVSQMLPQLVGLHHHLLPLNLLQQDQHQGVFLLHLFLRKLLILCKLFILEF